MAKKNAGGRPSLFGPKIKDSKYRVQGLLTVRGTKLFDVHRQIIAKSVDRPVDWISDADVIEMLANFAAAMTLADRDLVMVGLLKG